MLHIPLNEALWLALAILVAGGITGILAGLFGIGGGAIIVPVLFEVFRILGVPPDVRMQLCIGTSLAIIVPTTIRSYRAHSARGAVLPGVVRTWAAPAIIGVALGSIAAAFAPASVFTIAFVVFAVFIASKALVGRDDWRVSDHLPGRAAMNFYGFLLGLCSSLMGISGGSLSNFVLTLYGQPLRNAVATSAGVGVPITIAGTIGYVLAGWPHQGQMPVFSLGFVSALGVLLIAPLSSFTAAYGVRLAHWLPKRWLEVAFGLFLLLVAARFLVSLF
ncbi:MAG: sulfite exporter TauE/SafE family protein [Alphaproteobacteria bacterium]|nr:sulfite exporter TauE/SafE family protein [Alphaproteobacteria bacterium]